MRYSSYASANTYLPQTRKKLQSNDMLVLLSISETTECEWATVKTENCVWILFVLCVRAPHTKKLAQLHFLYTKIHIKRKNAAQKIHITPIVSVSSIKMHNKTTAQFSVFTV